MIRPLRQVKGRATVLWFTFSGELAQLIMIEQTVGLQPDNARPGMLTIVRDKDTSPSSDEVDLYLMARAPIIVCPTPQKRWPFEFG